MESYPGRSHTRRVLSDEAGLPRRPANQQDDAVAVWRAPMDIPTYLPAEPSRYPAYLDRRVYQGSSGRVYPLPFHERISRQRTTVRWDAVHLENPWLRLVILPELGGRIHVGLDRSSGYHFFYYNPVIKPALVGLTGPWIAGGVEFNWPQHHRPATFLPTDVEVEREPDGSVTVWCSDHDPFARMKGMHGIRLRPDRSTVEVRVRLYNRSELTQTFLWWANVAAQVHEDYQSFFPRDVRAVADHARRAVTAFPAADRSYYGVDYPAAHDRVGVASDGARMRGDRLDWYRNIPVPTSYMCLGSREGFFGGYDHRARAGFVHVADRRRAVGKKQWTWGSAEFGRAWCRNLADDDAAYVELMAGVFTDNQPDFSFIAPGETKVFAQTWYPIQAIGPVEAATEEAALAVAVHPAADGVRCVLGLTVTARHAGCEIRVEDPSGTVLATVSADIDPGTPWQPTIALPGVVAGTPLRVRVRSGATELVTWSSEIPTGTVQAVQAALEPPLPAAVGTVEELLLIGTHLEQYRHATRSPEPYWEQALLLDPGSVGARTALARSAYRRADFATAETLLRGAVQRLTARNPNPPDTAALYLRGLVLRRQGELAGAYDNFAAAAWSRAWRGAAGYQMAQLSALAGNHTEALERLRDVQRGEPEHLQARDLMVVVLRRLGHETEASDLVRATLALDPLDWWALDLSGRPLGADAQTCLDVALDYSGAGEWDDALRVLKTAAEQEAHRVSGQPGAGPLIAYHRAAILRRAGRVDEAMARGREAREVDTGWCFPVRLDDAVVLAEALHLDRADARARALLGHWLYAHDRPAEAVQMWEASAAVDDRDPVVWRNLGLAAYNQHGDSAGARVAYDRALDLRPTDPQLVYESDQLDRRRGVGPAQRLAVLRARRSAVEARDDATVEFAHLLMSAGKIDEARELLLGRTFQPWEGGEGQVLGAWDRVCLLGAHRALARGEARSAGLALRAVSDALEPPRSLGEARHPLASTARLNLTHGDALAADGDAADSRRAWELAAAEQADFVGMRPESFSDATPSVVAALLRLGRHAEARSLAAALRADCARLATEPAAVDFFATSLPSLLLFDSDLAVARRTAARFRLAALVAVEGDRAGARRALDELLAEQPDHVAAIDLRAVLDQQETRALVPGPLVSRYP
jgi:tetratricopeptide (TPR) repeat protein